MKKKFALVAVFMSVFTWNLFAQISTTDSLRGVLEQAHGREEVDIYNELSVLYMSNDLEEAWKMAEEAFELAKQADYSDGEADALLNLGRIQNHHGNYTDAMDYLLRALTIYELTANKLQMAYVHNDLGIIYYSLEQADKLLDQLNMAFALFKEVGNEKGIADITNNIGIYHDLTGNLDTALIFYKESLDTNLKIGASQEAANCRLNMAAVYSLQKKNDLARMYIDEANDYFIESDDKNAQVVVFIEKASLAANEKDYSSAIELSEQGLALAREIGSLLRIKNISSDLIEYYTGAGDAANSYKYFKLYDSVNDSIYNENNAGLLAEMETRFKTELKDKEIEALNLSMQQEKFRRNSFAALSILIVIISILLINRKRLEARKNKELYDKGQEVEKTKSRFFANITHEFRTPLTLILGPIEILKTRMISPEAEGHLQVMEKNSNRLLDLINQLLDISKIESGNMKLQTEEIDILMMLKRICGLFESRAERKKINLSIKSELADGIMYLDVDKIEKIFVNLISNALKFTQEEGMITITLVEKTQRDESGLRNIEVRIKDNGTGIPPEDLEHVFKPYFQSSSHSGGEYMGTGIGLSLTKELVELHGGSISVSSTSGNGTEFIISFPSSSLSTSNQRKQEVSKDYNRDRETVGEHTSEGIVEEADRQKTAEQDSLVLLVEDNEEVREYVHNILRTDYRMVASSNGEEGFDKALDLIPDLVISDVMMPLMNGYELCEKLKSDEKTSHIPVILLTAKASVEDRIIGFEQKADDYLAKPFVPKELQVRVSNLIESRHKIREKFSKEFIFKPGELEVKSMDESFLEKLKGEVEKNLDNEQLGVLDIAASMSMSRSQLLRKLKALTNLAPNEFIRNYRLVRARELIINNAGSTAEIAFNVGFSSPSYFTRCFREYFGTPPSELRQQ